MSESTSSANPGASNGADRVVRAITDDGSFRVITASTTHTVREACSVHGATGRTTQHFGDLLTGSVLFRETMAPQLRVQAILVGSAGSGRLLADSHPSGDARGMLQLKSSPGLDLGTGAHLQVMRSVWSGALQQGMVEATESSGGVCKAFMSYLQSSEQIVSMMALDTVIDGDRVVASGGYMVQLLPELERGPLAVMTERLEDFRSIAAQLRQPGFSPDALMAELLYGMPFTRLEENPVRYNCWCSEASMLGALASLPHNDIEDLVSDGEVLEIDCDWCRTEYKVAPERLRGMLSQN